MSTLAATALDTQLDLLRWYRTPHGARYANLVCSNDPTALDSGSDSFGERLHTLMLTLGETYVVTSEILDLLEASMPSMPEYPLHDEDLPTSGGFVFLERPAIIHDGTGKILAVKAFAWHKARPHPNVDDVTAVPRMDPGVDSKGVVMLQFTDPSTPEDHMHGEWLDVQRDLANNQIKWAPYWSLWGGTWEFGQVPSYDIQRLFAVFLRFIQETYVSTRRFIPERAVIKRSKRLREVKPEVRIVHLRRPEHKVRREPSGEKVEWSHRWIVEGHWRRQWYPSLQEHRPKWIPSYIKGPDDKPLIVHDKVYVVDR